MTIRQIAKAFGVAPSTVSVVLNNRPGVRSELRQKIREALVENGYQIREQATHQGNILFIYYKSTNYLAARKDDTIAQTLSGIEDACMDRKFTFSITNASPSTLDEILLSITPEVHSGVILLGTEYYQEPSQAFFSLPVPLVILDGYFPEYPLNTVNIDNSYGIHEALKLLRENNHPKIGYIKSSIEFGCLRDRARCIYSSLSRLGWPSEPEYVIQVSQEPEKSRQEIDEFLHVCPAVPSAFIADNDIIAASAVQSLQHNGFRIPEDVSVIGFDDSSICTILTPCLTTVRYDLNGMAQLATLRLIDMIESPTPHEIIKSTVGTKLIQRQSVAPYLEEKPLIDSNHQKSEQ